MNASDRGRQIKHRSENPRERHYTDVRGAMGCYYCWLGDYAKCEQKCRLVHTTEHDSLLQAGSHAVADQGDRNAALNGGVWQRAAPGCTRRAAQNRSMFNLGTEQQQQRQINDRLRQRKAAVADRAAVARATVHSANRPQQFIPLYKHSRESERVQATQYTTLAINPASHCFLSHHGKYVAGDDAIWSGAIVKTGRGSAAAPPSAGARLRAAGGGAGVQTEQYFDDRTYVHKSASRGGQATADGQGGLTTSQYSVTSPAASTAAWRGPGHGQIGALAGPTAAEHQRQLYQEQRLAPPSVGRPLVTEDAQLGSILSGRYDDAFDMPLPGTFLA
jgi:hypothetical protein